MPNEKIAFLSDGIIHELRGEKPFAQPSTPAENYMQTIKELNAKNDWKQSGRGAQFMGMSMHLPGMDGAHEVVKPHVTGLAVTADNVLAYTLNTGDMGGIYLKNLDTPEEKDGYVLVKRETALYDLDAYRNRFATTTAQSPVERHITVITSEGGDLVTCTDGDCRDANPTWSRAADDVLLYDSCGIGFGEQMQFMQYGPKSVYRLHIRTGALDEVFEGGTHEYWRPFEAQDGTLYCIRRPYHNGKSEGISLAAIGRGFKDLLLFPVRLLKALFGWLNFFTQRYAGESLKTSGGANPSKSKQKSEEQLFVEGNLLDAEKNRKANAAHGEKNAGYAPSSWELIARGADGTVKVVRKGVLDYHITADGEVVFSNGKYILRMRSGADANSETRLGAAHLGVKLTAVAANMNE